MYNRISKFDRAENLLREQLKNLKNKSSENLWLVAISESQLGYSLFKQSKNLEAEGLLIRGFNLLKEKKGMKNSNTKKSLERIIDFYKSKGREDKVLEYSSKL